MYGIGIRAGIFAQLNAGSQRKKKQTREDEKKLDKYTFDQKVDKTKTKHIKEQSKGIKGELKVPNLKTVDKPKDNSLKPTIKNRPNAKTDTSDEN